MDTFPKVLIISEFSFNKVLGEVQEESSYMNIPCFTLRKNTERPITISKGTNTLVNLNNIRKKIKLNVKQSKVNIPKWDGMTAHRILKVLKFLKTEG